MGKRWARISRVLEDDRSPIQCVHLQELLAKSRAINPRTLFANGIKTVLKTSTPLIADDKCGLTWGARSCTGLEMHHSLIGKANK